MVTIPLEVVEQPVNVYVTEYVVVDAGVTETEAVVCPPGDHAYVPPASEGVAVNVVDVPAQIDAEFTATVG